MERGSRQFSARMAADVLDALEAQARRSGQARSRLAERFIDEGLRMDQHPGIVFRPGTAGRRPGLVAGPDVWEVVGVLKDAPERGDAAIGYTAEYLSLTPAQVRAALSYYAAHKDEIDGWIARNDELAAAAEAAWRREQAALA